MGSTMTIGLLMMASGAMPKGRWESIGAWGSGCACLDISSGLEVLALLGGMRCTNGSRGGEFGGLRVAYWRWGGLEDTSLLEDGTVKAWDESWGAEAFGLASRDAKGSIWPPLMHAMAEMGWEVDVASSNGWSQDVHWRESRFARWCRVSQGADWAFEMNRGFGGL